MYVVLVFLDSKTQAFYVQYALHKRCVKTVVDTKSRVTRSYFVKNLPNCSPTHIVHKFSVKKMF
jgi:hypothetical protein